MATTESGRRAVELGNGWWFTRHAVMRMQARGLSRRAVLHALLHGRRCHVGGMCIHALGRREVARGHARGVDLREASGVQVVCSHDRRIVTVYRNTDFTALRRRRGRRRFS